MPGVDGVDRLVDGSAGIVRAPNMQDHFPETHSCDWEIVAGVEDPRDAFAEDLGVIFVGKVAKAFYFGFFVAAVGRIVDHDRKLIRHRFLVRGEREAAIDLDRRAAQAPEVEALRDKKYFGRGEIADKGEVFGHIGSLYTSNLLDRGIPEVAYS